MKEQDFNESRKGLDIAVVGMAGRFPGAGNIDQFWKNLRDGVEAISFFTDEQMTSFGVDPAMLRDPNFVKAGALLDNIDQFDRAFFGYSPREAELLDPQHRIFLECAWEALENAGYDAQRYEGLIGVYAGTSLSTYLLFNILTTPLDARDTFQVMIGNDKDFLSTRVSYDLNLKGPSINVQTACSTSLVAVHLASQALLSYQCDMALAGGISVQVPQRTGYYYEPEGINTPDGHCRAFDAQANGTIFGSGVGILVLKRLADAIAGGDQIHAVIKGSAINNDGSSKIGYTAPGVDGQAQVIELAQMVAEVEAETIQYVEAHGTATALGDPAEVAALTRAFRAGTDAKGFCALGTVKTNVGHLDAAAGITGLIKSVLALQHKMLPPSLHFEQPNPAIDFENSPFYVNATLSEWKSGSAPRRAGISSFGIGGTNAHVIIEEAPELEASSQSRPWQLLVLSAKTETALEAATANLIDYLRLHKDANLADVAYTLQTGRTVFNYRRAVICNSNEDALKSLESLEPQRVFTLYQEPSTRPLVFMFPGGGAQYVNMGLGLYQQEPVFREHIDECSRFLMKHLGYDLRDRLYPDPKDVESVTGQMKQTSLGLPALFAVEYALARLWMSWGIRPEAMIGHSLGEYTAACLAGVFSLEEALLLVHTRAMLFEQLPKGAMLSIPLQERDVLRLMSDGLSIAAINGQSQCVVSGAVEVIDRMAELLSDMDVEFRKVQIDVAAHSHMVTPILDKFARVVKKMRLQPPSLPYVSNVTGTWVTDEEATSPDYWVRHLRQTVRFADGLQQLFQDSGSVLLEVGPGQSLTTIARSQLNGAGTRRIIPSMRHPYDRQPDLAALLAALGKLWAMGSRIDWTGLYANERRQKTGLPAYPFERQRYWIEAGQTTSTKAGGEASLSKKADIGEWFYIPSWKRSVLRGRGEEVEKRESRRWIVMEDEEGVGERLRRKLEERGNEVIRVRRGERYERVGEREYVMSGSRRGEYERMVEELGGGGKAADVVIHLWSVGGERGEGGEEGFRQEQERGYYSLINLVRAFDKAGVSEPLKIVVISNNLHSVTGEEIINPSKSTIVGACNVMPQEYSGITCKCIDIVVPEPGSQRETILTEQLLAEADSTSPDTLIAYRGGQRWVRTYDSVKVRADAGANKKLRDKGVYLITDGLTGIGFAIAHHLASSVKARLVLVEKEPFLPPENHQAWLTSHNNEDEVSRKIIRLQALEEKCAEILLLNVKPSDIKQMQAVVQNVIERFGEINGVIYASGISGMKAFNTIRETGPSECERHFESKVTPLFALEKALENEPLDFCLLDSSLSSVLGGVGYATYAATNLFVDAFAQDHNRTHSIPWVSVNWDVWKFDREDVQLAAINAELAQLAMSSQEGIEVFERVLSLDGVDQIVISTGDLQKRIRQWINVAPSQRATQLKQSREAASLYPRPKMPNPYVAPSNELERAIAGIWQTALGIEQIGMQDNFFDLGGDSLLAVQVIGQMQKELELEISVVSLYEGVTIRSLSELLGSDESESDVVDEKSEREERIARRKQIQRQKRSRSKGMML